MNLNQIPANEVVLIDANIFIYAIQQLSQQCKRLLLRCADEELIGVLPIPVLAEVMHQLMLAEARDNGWIHAANPAKQLSRQPEIVQKLSRYEDCIRDLLALGLRLEPLGAEDFTTAMNLQRRFGLLTNDSLLVAMMQRLRITSLASADQIFSRVQGIMVYGPDDIRMEL